MMRRTQIQLDEDTYTAIRERAFATRRSIAGVIRDTLASAMQMGKTRPAAIEDFQFVAAGRSRQRPGRPVSERHDAALAEALAASRGRRR